jgi:rhamnulokinase
MTTYYLACDLGAESGRVMHGTLDRGRLTLQELHRFLNPPVQKGGALTWDVENLFRELIAGLRKAAEREDPISSLSCDAWGLDYMLFDKGGNVLAPTYNYRDARTEKIPKQVFNKVSWENIFDQTGVQYMPINTLFQLAAEPEKRLRKAHQLLLIGDGFNYLLSGVARADQSSASTTQLYNPRTETWADPLIAALNLPRAIFPPIIPCGSKLGPLRPDIVKQTRLQHEDIDRIEVIASCSHDTAAADSAPR